MIISIIVGFILGFILAIPPGPVAVTAMKLTLEKGAKHGKMVAFGTSIIDIFFALITVFATSFVVKLFSDITNYNPLLFLVFQILVCSFYAFWLNATKAQKTKYRFRYKQHPFKRIELFK
jgi:threonine/homoserine/homoserine lactone efflux protein